MSDVPDARGRRFARAMGALLRHLPRRGAQHHFEDLFENARDAIYVHDLFGRYLAVNRAAEELLGYTREEICSMTIAEILAPESAARAAGLLAELRGERPPSTPDDQLVEFEVREEGRPPRPDRGERARDR